MNESTELVTAEKTVAPSESPIVQKEGGNIACTTLVPEKMSLCQNALVAWCRDKAEKTRAEAKEMQEAFEHAKARKWKTGTLRTHANLASERVVFYEKMLSALEHGFVIVPNFPVSMFAIRSDDSPHGRAVDVKGNYYIPSFQQSAEALPAGEGEYKNPFPLVSSYISRRDEKGNEITRAWPSAWDELNFPITMAKPEIMRATDRAMALKIFDQFGILPSETPGERRAKGDPIIVGQLLDPRGRIVTFMIAWHLDTRAL